MHRRRLTVAELPTFRIGPLEPPPSRPSADCTPLARRDPGRFATSRSKVLAALRAFGRELSRGEIAGYVLSALPGREVREVLASLVQETEIQVRSRPYAARPGEPSWLYSLPPTQPRQGGES